MKRAAVLAVMLVACDTARAPQDEIAEHDAARLTWGYNQANDTLVAHVDSVNAFSLMPPNDGNQRAILSRRYLPKVGGDLVVRIRRGRFDCPIAGCTVGVRFDDGAEITWAAERSGPESHTEIFLAQDETFVARMRAATVARVRVELEKDGAREFEFRVAGYDDSRMRP